MLDRNFRILIKKFLELESRQRARDRGSRRERLAFIWTLKSSCETPLTP